MILMLVYFVWLAAQRRKNWPRWVLVAALVLSVISLVQSIGDSGMQLDSAIEIVSCALTAAGLYFSFTGDAKAGSTGDLRSRRSGAMRSVAPQMQLAASTLASESCTLHPMEWTDEGIVLGVRRHGESSAIVELLTRGHGRHLGLVRGGAGQRMRPMLQPGNSVSAVWRARLDEHLGTTRSRARGCARPPCWPRRMRCMA